MSATSLCIYLPLEVHFSVRVLLVFLGFDMIEFLVKGSLTLIGTFSLKE